MFKIKKKYIEIIIGAVLLIILAVYLQQPNQNKGLVGVLLGVGVSIALNGIISTITLRIQANSPIRNRQAIIEQKDERNISIRYRAKAEASDISGWFLMVIAYLNILIEGPLWLTLVTVGAFLIHYLMVLGFIGKYSKEM